MRAHSHFLIMKMSITKMRAFVMLKAVRSADILGLRVAGIVLFDKEETNGIKFYKSRTLGK